MVWKGGERQLDAVTAASNKQSATLFEVNPTVNQMDQVTQQNAAMAEESTAGAKDHLILTPKYSILATTVCNPCDLNLVPSIRVVPAARKGANAWRTHEDSSAKFPAEPVYGKMEGPSKDVMHSLTVNPQLLRSEPT
ncbi:hypothetical protein HFN46_33445 [Rhizobium leguminosarum]|nr:hypothetical protein [Rhizobium leguminosarum]